MTAADGLADAAEQQSCAQARWPLALAVLAVCSVVLGTAFWSTLASLLSLWWNNSDYGHGLLIAPLSAYLIWMNREVLARRVPRPCLWAAVLLAPLTTMWFVAHVLGVQLVEQVVLVALIGTVVLVVLGARIAWVLAFPIVYLLLVIPVWSLFVPVLQNNTATMSTALLRMLGVPVHLEGHYLSIPSGRFVVAEVCAGLRFLLATMAIAALYAYLHFRSLWRGIVFFSVCVGLAIFYNWVRVVAIVLVGHWSEMRHPLVEQHLAFGWVLFAVTLIPMFLLGAWLRGAKPHQRGTETVPGRDLTTAGPARASALITAGLTATILAVLGPAFAFAWAGNDAARQAVVVGRLAPAQSLPGWSGPARRGFDWRPQFRAADAEDLVFYDRDGQRIGLYIAYYARQRQGTEVVNDRNRVFDNERWRRSSSNLVVLPGLPDMRVRESHLYERDTAATRIALTWYQVGGRTTARAIEAKLLQLRSLISGDRSAAAVVLVLDVDGDWAEARARLLRFAALVAPRARMRIAAMRAQVEQ